MSAATLLGLNLVFLKGPILGTLHFTCCGDETQVSGSRNSHSENYGEGVGGEEEGIFLL